MGNGLGDSKLDGWNDPAEEAATFPPKVVPVSDLYDYQTWAKETRGWRKLEAAVNGGAALTTESGRDHAKTLVSVRSVVETAQAFQATQDLLIWLEQTIRTAVTSMVGDDKAWKGPAANGFRDKMNFYADLLGKQAEHLAGGAVPDSTTAANSINSSTNRNSLPSQLYDAANHLSWAQQTIAYLDGAWATIASDNGVGSGSGPVPISGTEYEKPMAQQMSEVVHTVAEKYRMTTDKAGTSGVTMPTPSINVPTGPPISSPNLTTPTLTTPPTITPPGFTAPPAGGITTPGFTTPPNITVPSITPPNLADIGGPGSGQGPGAITPPSFSGPGEIGGPTPGGGGGSGLPGFDAPGINGPGGAGFPGVGVPGGGGLPGGLGSGVVPPGIKPPGSANLGGGAGGAGSVKPPSFSGPGEVGGPKPGAGTGTGTGIGKPGGGFTAPSIPGFGPPGGAGPGAGGSPGLPEKPDANGLLGNSDDFVPGAVDGVDIPAAPGGAVPGGGGFQSPMMPGMPGAGAPGAGAGGGSGVPEAPDAKGLVEGDEADWRSPGFDGVQVPGAPAGVSAGGAGLGAGMPPMPGMPGPAGGATNPGGAESPDARGLVSGDPETWGPVGVDAGVPDGSGGAPAGGDGLGVDGPQIPAAPVAPGVGVDSPVTAPAGAAMPMMPGAPGAPGAGAGAPAGVPDAPDASGLVEADADDWRPSTPDAGAPQAPTGAGTGGAGLVEPVPVAPPSTGVTLPSTDVSAPVAGVLPPMGGPPGSHAPAGTTPRTAPAASDLIRPDETEWTPARPEDCAPEAGDGTVDPDGAAPVTAVPGSRPDGPPAGPDPGVPEAAAEEPAPDVPAAPVSGTGGTPGVPVPEVVVPPTAVEVPTVVDLSPAVEPPSRAEPPAAVVPPVVGGVVAAPVIVGQPGLPAAPGPVPNPPAQPGQPSQAAQPGQAASPPGQTAAPNPSGQANPPAQPNSPAQSNQQVSPGGGGPEGTQRRTAVVADGEVAVAVPGALGLAGAAAVAGVGGPQTSGRAASGAGPDDPGRTGTVRARSDRDDEREPGAGREPAAGLREDDAVWGGDRARPAAGDHVPLVRPDDDPDDTAGWDDLSDADWLTGPSADDGREG
ncbi:hypothetical protein [Micromonospora sp. NPDC048169]|uniref:hypothetical protein n=1 Tax=unclassified Micromonospora TaxID=2617518 RepID=UPI0033DD74FF